MRYRIRSVVRSFNRLMDSTGRQNRSMADDNSHLLGVKEERKKKRENGRIEMKKKE